MEAKASLFWHSQIHSLIYSKSLGVNFLVSNFETPNTTANEWPTTNIWLPRYVGTEKEIDLPGIFGGVLKERSMQRLLVTL